MATSRTGLTPIYQEREPLVDRVTQIVRQLIVDGTLRPGDTVSITELANDLGLSHSPVREAVQRLAGQGLVDLRPGRTAVVAALDIDDLCDIYRLRTFIEVDAATRAAPDLSDRDLQELRQQFDRMTELQDSGSEDFWVAHDAFHLILIRRAISPRVESIIVSLWHASVRYIHVVAPSPQHTVGEFHRPLLEMAQARDGAGMGRELSIHLERSGGHLIDGLAQILDA